MQEYLIAFAVGGTICALSQLLMDKTKLMPGRIMVILVVTGVVLGAFGIYEPFKEWAGAGASVPLLGFGNTLWKGVKKAVDEEGLLGIFKGGLTASSAGICAAIVFGYLASSAIKRNQGIKDYCKLIPGHVVILYRFDLVLFTAPFIYYLAKIILGI